jgi:hypothetical protein
MTWYLYKSYMYVEKSGRHYEECFKLLLHLLKSLTIDVAGSE